MSVPASGTFLYLIKTNTFAGTNEQLLTPADSWFDPRLSAEEFKVWVTRFDYAHWWSVFLEAPIGHALAVGTYNDALKPELHNAVNPGMDSGGDGQGCNEVHGNFTVDALSRAASGEIRVFQATFHYYCDVSVVQPIEDRRRVLDLRSQELPMRDLVPLRQVRDAREDFRADIERAKATQETPVTPTPTPTAAQQ